MKLTLDSPVSSISRLLKDHAIGLDKLKIKTIKDLLFYFPVRYGDVREVVGAGNLESGQTVTIYGLMEKVNVRRSFHGHTPMTEAHVVDNSGSIRCIWFNQAYIGKMYPDGTRVKISGTIQSDKKGFFLSNPIIERTGLVTPETQESLFAKDVAQEFLIPVYRETRGVSSLFIYNLIKKAVASGALDEIEDAVPQEILDRLHLPKLKEAILYIHFPKNEDLNIVARKRFAFEEIFYLQLKNYREKLKAKESLSHKIKVDDKLIKDFVNSFSFKPTKAQLYSIENILKNINKNHPMSLLLEGDVGSGKTFVAACAVFATINSMSVDSGQTLQVAYMAPTEILAKQHFESFIKFFKHTNIEIGLLTSKGCKKYPSKTNNNEATDVSKNQLLKWITEGKLNIVIGTHSLIQKSVEFKNLALVIIDEQHRFGVKQRKALARKTNTDFEQTAQTNTPDTCDEFLYEDLSYILRGICFDIKKQIGLGHKELVYQNAFEIELQKHNINYKREVQLPVIYENKKIGVYQPDFIIDDKIIIEFKSIKFIGGVEIKQLQTYLKGSDYKLGFLINFGGNDIQMQRYVYDKARTGLRGLHKSAKSNNKLPHLLSMTATPIPRTLALTIFGDLDLLVIDEMPKERKKIITELVTQTKREEKYEFIREELKNGRQVYVICPRIDEQDEEEKQKRVLKSVKEEAKRLAEVVFPEFVVDVLHSKMKPLEKEEVMQDFLEKRSDILVATSVVEVGINVPNATVIIIEGAERFGLAQLHQLRGRVGRAEHQSYCYLFSDVNGETSNKRLTSLISAKNGFELAELDMNNRGIGTLFDGKQWGVSDLAMEAIKNPKLVDVAKREAEELLDKDFELKDFPVLSEKLDAIDFVHME